MKVTIKDTIILNRQRSVAAGKRHQKISSVIATVNGGSTTFSQAPDLSVETRLGRTRKREKMKKEERYTTSPAGGNDASFPHFFRLDRLTGSQTLL